MGIVSRRMTKFKKHKSFKSEPAAEKYIEKIKRYHRGRTFSIVRRTFPGKFKVKYLVRSV